MELKQAGIGGYAPLSSGQEIVEATEDIFPFDAIEFDDPKLIRSEKGKTSLRIGKGWTLDSDSIQISGSGESLKDLLEKHGETVESNRNEINSTQGNLNLVSETVYDNGIITEASLDLISQNASDIEVNGGNITINGEAIAENSAAVVLKAEVRDSGGTAKEGAYLTMAAGLGQGSEIKLDADKIRIGTRTDANNVDVGDVLLIDGNDVVIGDYNDDLGNGSAGIKWDQDGGTLNIHGDLEITSDDANRFVSAGSRGLYVEDQDGEVIHDLPDSVVGSEIEYAGHLLLKDDLNTTNIITKTYAQISTSSSTSYDSGYINYTVPSALLGENGNVKGAFLRIQLLFLCSTLKWQAQAAGYVNIFFYATGSGGSRVRGGCSASGVVPYGQSAGTTTELIVPMPSSGVLTYRVTGGMQNLLTASGNMNIQAIVDLQGLLI